MLAIFSELTFKEVYLSSQKEKEKRCDPVLRQNVKLGSLMS